MKPEHQHLLDDLWDEPQGTRRDVILQAGKTILRRKRRVRLATHVLACSAGICVLLGVVWSLSKPALSSTGQTAMNHHPSNDIVAAGPQSKSTTPALKVLTEQELFEHFPGVAVGITVVNGRKHFIFPRPEDREKYVLHVEPSDGI